jgi:aspartyl/glutamyl-tRNA(Asn/Gln) amidotransferase C subunit
MAPAAGLPEPVDLQALCALTRLRVPLGMQDELRRRLHAVLQSFASLGAIDTSSAPPADEPPSLAQPSATGLRPDRAEPPMPTELALANAPRVLLNAFLVPRVVEG